MSGTASVSTQFQGAVTATGLQLDNNFASLVSYANDPTNRANYAADGGTTNTLVINPSPPAVGGYTAGLTITFKAAFTNSGAVVANVNGLGNRSVLDQQGRQLTTSAIISGSIYQMGDNGTAFYLLSPNSIVASQPVLTSLLSGTATYTVSSGAVRIHVRGIGAGGGGGTFGVTTGSTGSSTRFGTLLGAGGLGGVGDGTGGVGGTATGATINIIGGGGGTGNNGVGGGGNGGSGFFGGAGREAVSGETNSGGGGGGDTGGGGGGGSGAYFEHFFSPPAATYTYQVGLGGAGPGGTTGGSGRIDIITYFA